MRHFRYEDRRWHWEFPGGFGNRGKSSEYSAVSELFEETGLISDYMMRLGIKKEPVDYYVAHVSGEVKVDRAEGIFDYKICSVEETILTCDIDDLMTIRAYVLAKFRGEI